jgi:hypothetical protein
LLVSDVCRVLEPHTSPETPVAPSADKRGTIKPGGTTWPSQQLPSDEVNRVNSCIGSAGASRQLASLRAEVRRWLVPLALAGDTEDDVVLAVSEAASNSIEHAYTTATDQETVDVTFWTEPHALCLHVTEANENLDHTDLPSAPVDHRCISAFLGDKEDAMPTGPSSRAVREPQAGRPRG